MKKIFAIAVIALSAAGISAGAQTQAAEAASNKMYQPREFTEMAFEGILLDIDQQTKINEINDQYKARREQAMSKRNEMREQMRGKKGAGCDSTKCDKAACDKGTEMRPEGAHGMNRGHVSREYVEQVKEVLTPEQYTTFLENIMFMPAPEQMGNPRGDRAPRSHVMAPRGGKNGKAPQLRSKSNGERSNRPTEKIVPRKKTAE